MNEKEMINDYLAEINSSIAAYGGIIVQTENEQLRQTIVSKCLEIVTEYSCSLRVYLWGALVSFKTYSPSLCSPLVAVPPAPVTNFSTTLPEDFSFNSNSASTSFSPVSISVLVTLTFPFIFSFSTFSLVVELIGKTSIRFVLKLFI